jgi:hypothetical protein
MVKTNEDFKEQNLYQNLQQRYEEMNDFLMSLLEDTKCNETDLKYLTDFIHYKNLDEEFRCFRENAHEDTASDLPFPRLTL